MFGSSVAGKYNFKFKFSQKTYYVFVCVSLSPCLSYYLRSKENYAFMIIIIQIQLALLMSLILPPHKSLFAAGGDIRIIAKSTKKRKNIRSRFSGSLRNVRRFTIAIMQISNISWNIDLLNCKSVLRDPLNIFYIDFSYKRESRDAHKNEFIYH